MTDKLISEFSREELETELSRAVEQKRQLQAEVDAAHLMIGKQARTIERYEVRLAEEIKRSKYVVAVLDDHLPVPGEIVL